MIVDGLSAFVHLAPGPGAIAVRYRVKESRQSRELARARRALTVTALVGRIMADTLILSGSARGSLATAVPRISERVLALAVMLVSLAGFACIVPFAKVNLPRVPAVIGMYEGALFICDLVTAVLIAWQMTQVRSRSLLVLTTAYVFDAAMMIPHALSFPGLFAPDGLLPGGNQTTAELFIFWHAGFPLFVIAYALASSSDPRNAPQSPSALKGPLLIALLGGVLAAGTLTMLAVGPFTVLPVLTMGDSYRPALVNGVSHATWVLSLIAFLLLKPWRPRSVLDLWMGVVMFAWMLDVGASALIGSARYDLGFYAGRLYGLCAATFVMITLLIELGRISQRLAAAVELEGRARVLGQIVEAEERERGRIARELHDEMGSYLTAMKARVDLWQQKHGAADVEDMKQLLGRADAAVDTLAFELRPPTLDDMGVSRAIAQLAAQFTSATGIPVHLHQNGSHRVPHPVETTIYRVIQEALTNVGKHSGARTVSVILDARADNVRLIVEDDGRGFEPPAEGEPAGRHRYGLVGMEERVRMAGGNISIESGVGSGTSLYVTIPFAASEVSQR